MARHRNGREAVVHLVHVVVEELALSVPVLLILILLQGRQQGDASIRRLPHAGCRPLWRTLTALNAPAHRLENVAQEGSRKSQERTLLKRTTIRLDRRQLAVSLPPYLRRGGRQAIRQLMLLLRLLLLVVGLIEGLWQRLCWWGCTGGESAQRRPAAARAAAVAAAAVSMPQPPTGLMQR